MAPPVRPTPPAPTPGDVDLLISQPAFSVRVRRVGIAATSALAVTSLLGGRDGWTTAGFVALAAVLLIAEIHERRVGPPPTRSWRLTVAGIMAVMASVVLLTGGVGSTLLILLVPIGFTLGFSLPRARVSGAPAAFVALLMLGTALAAPEGHRWSWSWSTSMAPDELPALYPTMIALFSLLCARLGRDARQSLVQAREAAEQAHAARLQAVAERHAGLLGLMGAVAHELKNPLTTVQSLTSHLHRKAEADSPLQARLGVVRGEVARMRSTVDCLLNAARPIGVLAMVPDALHGLAADVVATHSALAAGKGVALITGPGTAEAVFDRRKLVQVTGNLVLNAIEAVEAGGRVEVDVGRDADGAWLEVRDDGPGLAAEIRDTLGRPGVTTKPGGSGIGLALSQSIVEQHGGLLTLRDAPGGGCHARIRLPAEPPSAVGENT